MATAQAQRVEQYYAAAAQDLVDAHANLARSPLVLAVRYHLKGDLDLYILEIIENFPGQDDDPPFATEFAPNERLRILGNLHLTLVSPKQLENARVVARGPARGAGQDAKKLLDAVKKDGRVLFEAPSPPSRAKIAKAMRKALGLP